MTLTRMELFDLVWTVPMSALAPRYGMSDVGFKKLCGRHDIPTPGLGYWTKVRFGKRVHRPRLKGDPNEAVSVVVTSAKVHRGVSDSELVLRQKAFEAEEANRAVVADARRLSPAVAAIRDELKASRLDRYGRDRGGRSSFVTVVVSPAARRRALALAEALVRTGKRRGCEVVTTPPPVSYYRVPMPAGSVLRVHGQDFTLRLVERLHRLEHVPTEDELRRSSVSPPPEYDYWPCGELQLEIEGTDVGARRRRWRDTSKARLEDVLGEVFVELVRLAELRNEEQKRREEARRRAAEEAERLEAARQAREAELARRQQLEADAANWAKAEQIRAYVAAVMEEGSEDASGGLAEWERWALAHADRLDPSRRAESDEERP